MNRDVPGIKSNFFFLLSFSLMFMSIGAEQIIIHPYGFWGYLFILMPVLISLPKPGHKTKKPATIRHPFVSRVEKFLGLERSTQEMPDVSTLAEYECVAFQFFSPGPFDHILKEPVEPSRKPRVFKPHELLSVRENANAIEINRAYREKIKWLHPDALAGCSEEQLRYYEAASARLNSARAEMLKNIKHKSAA
jgi:hypothetical protein